MIKTVKLSEVCKISGRVGWKGYTVDDLCESGPIVLGANDITSVHSLDLSNVKHITRAKYEESPEIMVELNDILVVKVGSTIGKIAIIKNDIGEACINPNTLLLKKCLINPQYLYYYLISARAQKFLKNNSSSSAQPALNQTDLKELEIILPSESDQDKISKFLNSIDTKIEINSRINAELEAMAKTIYDYWFVQFDFPNENGEPYKSSGGKMLYNSQLKREIPEGWEVVSLWDIAKYYNGLALQNYRPKVDEQKLKVIKIREMNEGFSENTEYASINIPKEAIINNGDVLFSWSATLEVMIWSKGISALNQHIFKVTSKKYPRSFYFFELKNYLNHFKMMAEKRKTTMGHITQDHLKQSRIVVPPIDIINQLEKSLSNILDMQIHYEQENQQLTQLRDWLLPMLMNGQVTIKDEENIINETPKAAEPTIKYRNK